MDVWIVRRWLAPLVVLLVAVCPAVAGAAPLPVNSAPPAIAPAPVAGSTVRCDPGAWSGDPDGFDYEWQRNGVPFRWSSSYTVRTADAGAQLSCSVWARKDTARVRADAAAVIVPLPPARLSDPTLSGSSGPAGYARVGDTLTCAPGAWSGTGIAYSYRWTPTATGPSYSIIAADLGQRLSCQVTARNAGGARTATVSVTVLAGRPVNTAGPTVDGTVQAGATLTCRPGAWTNSPGGWSIRWFVDAAQVATGESLVVADAYQGHTVSCDVAALWSGGTTAPVGAAAVAVPFHAPLSVKAPALYGDAILGSSLTCTPGAWRYAGSYRYTWLRDGAPIHDGTDHAVVPMDAGYRLSCRVTATGPGGSVAADSDAPLVAALMRELAGSAGADRLVGRAGADVLRGGEGADVLLGGAGADRLVGGIGRDRLDGGTGDDLLDARDHRGGDVVRCGAGRDRALVDRGDRVSRDCESVRRVSARRG